MTALIQNLSQKENCTDKVELVNRVWWQSEEPPDETRWIGNVPTDKSKNNDPKGLMPSKLFVSCKYILSVLLPWALIQQRESINQQEAIPW